MVHAATRRGASQVKGQRAGMLAWTRNRGGIGGRLRRSPHPVPCKEYCPPGMCVDLAT